MRSSRRRTKCSAAQLRDQFVIDVYQAGAGTSHNMNANEVLANRAAELLGGAHGTYNDVHPNDHVNMGQSTNDVFPTATRLALAMEHGGLGERVPAAGGGIRRARRQRLPTCSKSGARICRMRCRSRSARSSAAMPRAFTPRPTRPMPPSTRCTSSTLARPRSARV